MSWKWHVPKCVTLDICKDCPPCPEAHEQAKQTKKPVRNSNGEVHCPCGTVTGLNLRGHMPPLALCHNCQTASLIKEFGE